MLIVLFLVSHFNFLFVPCGGLSWLPVSFLLHVKYTIVSYRMSTLKVITSQKKRELNFQQNTYNTSYGMLPHYVAKFVIIMQKKQYKNCVTFDISAVTKRGRAMLHVCQQLASVVQYLERSFFYYQLLRLRIYQCVNSIMFCFFGVTSRLAVIHTINVHHDCVQRDLTKVHQRVDRAWSSIPAVNRQPTEKCEIQTAMQQLLTSGFQPTPPTLDDPVRGILSEYCHAVWYRTRTQLSQRDRA